MQSRAFANYRVEWIGVHAAATAVEAADVPEVPSFVKVVLDQTHVTLVIQLVSDGYYLFRETAISMFLERRTRSYAPLLPPHGDCRRVGEVGGLADADDLTSSEPRPRPRRYERGGFRLPRPRTD